MHYSKSMDKLAREVIQRKYYVAKNIASGVKIAPCKPYPPSCRFLRDYIETQYSLDIAKKIKLWNNVNGWK